MASNARNADKFKRREPVGSDRREGEEEDKWLAASPAEFVRRLQDVKMIAMIQLATGLAHEINNPLSVIIGNLRTLEGYFDKMINMLEAGEKILEYNDTNAQRRAAFDHHWQQLGIDRIRHDGAGLLNQSLLEAGAISEIITNFKGMTHENRPDGAPIDVNFELERILTVISSDIPPGTRIKRKYGSLAPWHGNPALFCQTLVNILRNALQSRKHNLRIALRTRRRGNCLEIKVYDNGDGMDKATKERIFEPFFTTREVGQGLGLGLTTAYDFVHRKQGRLQVTSRSGKGTIVTVALPYPDQERDTKHCRDRAEACGVLKTANGGNHGKSDTDRG